MLMLNNRKSKFLVEAKQIVLKHTENKVNGL